MKIKLTHTYLVAVLISLINLTASAQENTITPIVSSYHSIQENGNKTLKTSYFRNYADSLYRDLIFKNTVKIESITELEEFSDTSIYVWLVDEQQNVEKFDFVDTSVVDFQKTSPLERRGGFFGYLGNIGMSAYNFNFSERNKNTDYFMQNGLSVYLRKAQDLEFYNTKKRYTKFDYTNSQSSKSESQQTIGIVHSQNVNKDFNVGLNYVGIMSKGPYQNQEVKYHSIGAMASYTGKKYTVYAQGVINKHQQQENGGIIQDTINQELWHERNTREVNVNFSEGVYTENRFTDYRIVQECKMQVPDFIKSASKRGQKPNTIFSLKHRFNFTRQYRMFSQQAPGNNPVSTVYYKNKIGTYDSTYKSTIYNRLQFEIKENNYKNPAYRFFGGIGWKHEKLFLEDSNVFVKKQNAFNENSYSYYVGGNGNFFERINYKYYYNQYFVGAHSGETDLAGELDLRFGKRKNLILRGAFNLDINKPDYFMNNYFSNHAKWNVNLDNVVNTALKFEVEETRTGIQLGVDIDQVDNYIYFDESKMISQASAKQTVLGAYLKNTTKFWFIEWENRIKYQEVDGNAIQLPEFMVYESLSFNKKIFNGVLDLRAGLEMYYTTAFNANAYDPITGQFYKQNTTSIGEYPLINVFIIGKLSRARLMLKYEHVNKSLFPDPTYFSIPNYPIGTRMIRWGISWTFYD